MWGAIAAAALGTAGSVAGGIMSASAARKQKKELDKQEAENMNWLNRRWGEDATQRADAQYMIEQTRAAARARNRAARGRQAVTGGTQAQVAATEQATNNMMADTAARIAAQGEGARRQAVDTYLARQQNLRAQRVGLQAQQAQNTATAVQGLGQSAAALASSVDDDAMRKAEAKNKPTTV